MKCLTCGFDNRTGVRFCENCGEELVIPVSEIKASQDQACKACGTGNSPDFLFCENCGAPLNAEPVASPVSIAKVQFIYCPNCGRKNSSEHRFCEACGTSLTDDGMAIQAPPRKKSSLTKWVLVGFGLAGLIALSVLFASQGTITPTTAVQPDYQEPEQMPVYAPETTDDNTQSQSPEVASTDAPETEPPQAAGDNSTEPAQSDSQNSQSEPPAFEPPPLPADPPKLDMDTYDPLSCENCGGGGSTDDVDHDGLQDWVEEYIGQTFAPYFVLDAHEVWWRPCFGLHEVSDNICINVDQEIKPLNFLYQVRPGTINGEPYALLVITVLYDIDYAPPTYVNSILWHYGDTETVELYIRCWSADCNEPLQGYWIDGMVINRHSEGFWYDASNFTMVDAYGQTPSDGSATHPMVFVSAGKHGAYSSLWECNHTEIEGGVDEHCSLGYVGVPPLWGWPVNVGEINYPNMAAEVFINNIYPNEKVWDFNYEFCGGQVLPAFGGNGELLFGVGSILGISDFFIPFWEDKYVPVCAGSIASKWYPFDVVDFNNIDPFTGQPVPVRHRPPFNSVYP